MHGNTTKVQIIQSRLHTITQYEKSKNDDNKFCGATLKTHLYKQTNKMHFLYVFILQSLYNSTCFERLFRSSSGVHTFTVSAVLYKPCKRV